MQKKYQLAIVLEKLMFQLYELYSISFPEYKEFWLKLASQEKDHMDFLRAVNLFDEGGVLNFDALVLDEESIAEKIKEISSKIEILKKENTSLASACKIAIELESISQEYHFHKMKIIDSKDILFNTFKNLYSEDISHIAAIKEFSKNIT